MTQVQLKDSVGRYPEGTIFIFAKRQDEKALEDYLKKCKNELYANLYEIEDCIDMDVGKLKVNLSDKVPRLQERIAKMLSKQQGREVDKNKIQIV